MLSVQTSGTKRKRAAARGHELVALEKADVWAKGRILMSPRIGGRIAHLSPHTRDRLERHITALPSGMSRWLFPGRGRDHLTARQYARLLKEWCAGAGITDDLGTESVRRARAQMLLDETGNFDAARQLLGITWIEAMRVLDIEVCTDLKSALREVEL